MVQKILLPIDHTDQNSWAKALPVAVEQAKFYGADLTVIGVIPEILHLPNLPANYGDGAAEHVKHTIGDILSAAGQPDLGIEIAQGSVYREILKYAHASDTDMIVMASAKGDFPNYEIGPNLARVVRNAHCNVLVVRS
ncbi:MAG: universal stress protein [Cohaesibacter sp.]|jgi:universal stress protein F|nr:universal stress protein [Cohaesibacter sp.]